MRKCYNLIPSEVPFELITGDLDFNLTNDYMFKVVMQECDEARRGLIGALLHLDPDSLEVYVENPIELGKSIAGKDFYLDVKVTVNKTKVLNLEMQVEKHLAWSDRSLSYSCRAFDTLCEGEDYTDIKPFQQIVFTCFDMFESNNRFYDDFFLVNRDFTQIYSDKFKLSVVNLKRIDEALDTDIEYKLDIWCRLITASTWQELKEIAKGDKYMGATAERLYFFSSEFDAREEAIRRKQYYSDMDRLKKELAQSKEVIAERDEVIAESAKELAEKDKMLEQQNAEIEELKEMIRSLKGGSKE